MESEDGGDRDAHAHAPHANARTSPDAKCVKRRMKTKEQRYALEKAYAEDPYPGEAMRAELSAALNLTDRQLQMWFGRQRMKEKKVKEEDNPSAPKKPKKEKVLVAEEAPPVVLPGGPALSAPQPLADTAVVEEGKQPAQGAMPKQKQAEGMDMEVLEWKEAVPPASKPRRRNPEGSTWRRPSAKNKRAAAEIAAFEAVEAQLGGPVRDDGPVLGVEFDPIPPQAFDGPPADCDLSGPPAQAPEEVPKVPVRRGLNARKVKAAARNRPPLPSACGVKRKATVKSASTSSAQPQARAVREYQFIPEQPTGRPDEPPYYDRTTQLNLYPNAERPFDVVSASRVRSLTPPGPLFPANEPFSAGEGYFHPRVPVVGASIFPTAEAGVGGLIAPNDLNFEGGQRLEGFTSFDVESHHALLQALASRKAFETENLSLFQEQEWVRMEKKRKMEEAKHLKEIEAHEKRQKKEEVARRKREDQLKKESDKQDRERKKELDKAMREQERLKREAQREEERQKKLLEKESKKLEKLQAKEELRLKKEAAKVKAANERATAKKLAKESMDLMDDERLELMEMAVSVQGVSSITELPAETLDDLDSFKAMLKPFPPLSLKMKKPLSISPWKDRKENMGNAIMAWRFLTSFADVLGLWPFTFDELIQAFHDYDPRLLGEVHMALLRTLVKDVEEAAQAAAIGVAGSQNALAIIAGGHPEIVEAAYAWGFDIREWRTHVSPLTWPEILRQFALAASFGPKWKKRKSEPSRPEEEMKVTEGDDVVSTLRSGAAAANAVALMQGKGTGHVRRNQYRMTPGTVKFAAFHILSLEGDKGLSILQVADRIQKSGLRDLSTSRTPEASIAAALSRDANLFERVAPSTYCVRPAFRKDPADADDVLEAAREKISLFQSGMLECEEADKEVEDAEEVEGGERDEEYDMEEQDMDYSKPDYADNTLQPPEKVVSLVKSEKAVGADDKKKRRTSMTSVPANSHSSESDNVDRDSLSVDTDAGEKDFQSPGHDITERRTSCTLTGRNENSKQDVDAKDEVSRLERSKSGLVYEETEIDESQVGEPWVQGLTEGEYADLSVEERLNALVVLVNVVNEGTTIRVALEERLEAAAALKRQMWAEAQLDRRRLKEEQMSRLQCPSAGKLEGVTLDGVADGRQSPLLGLDCKPVDLLGPPGRNGGAGGADPSSQMVASTSSFNPALQDINCSQDISLSAFAHSIEKSRAQLKADIGIRAEELYVLRSLPLGFDRRRNRYWQFVTSNGGEDPGCGRLYFESVEDCRWEVIDTEEVLEAFMAMLDTRGSRENNLHANLQRLEGSLRLAMQTRKDNAKSESTMNGHSECDSVMVQRVSGGIAVEDSPASGVFGQDSDSQDGMGAISVDLSKSETALERYRELERWMWNDLYQETSSFRAIKSRKKRDQELLICCRICHGFYWPRDRHCSCCHGTFDSSATVHSEFSEHLRECEEKMRSRDPSWELRSTCLPSRFQLLKAQTIAIEAAIPNVALKMPWKEPQRKAWACKLKQATTPGEVLQALTELENIMHREWLSSSYETTEEILKNVMSESASHQSSESYTANEFARVLPWIPQTTAGVALRVAVFDAAISYTQEEKLERERQKEQEAKDIKAGVSAVKISPDLLATDHNGAMGVEDGVGDLITDGKGRSRRRRGETQPRNRSRARNSGAGVGGAGGGGRDGGGSGSGKSVAGGKNTGAGRNTGGTSKRGLKRKLQFLEEGGAVGTPASENQPVSSKERKGPRSATGRVGGRPRGRPPGRPRNKGGSGRGGRRGKFVPGGQRKEMDSTELMTPADETQQKPSARHLDDESDEDDDGYQELDEQGEGDWGAPEESDDGDQYDEDQQEDEDNGEEMAEEEDEEEEIDEEDGSGDGRGQHPMDAEDEDDVRYEDGYGGPAEESEAEEEPEDDDRASEDEARDLMRSYSSDSQ